MTIVYSLEAEISPEIEEPAPEEQVMEGPSFDQGSEYFFDNK